MAFRFSPGRVVMTPGVAGLDIDYGPLLLRHLYGDWGDLCLADKRENELALQEGDRLLSSYRIDPDQNMGEDKVWIITEADRSVTTVLLPSEY